MATNRWACRVSVASILWLLAAAVSAQPPHRPPPLHNASGSGPQGMMPADQRFEPISARDTEPRGNGNRLSPAERRQLRRDVHDAGRDLYPDRMPPGGREPHRQ